MVHACLRSMREMFHLAEAHRYMSMAGAVDSVAVFRVSPVEVATEPAKTIQHNMTYHKRSTLLMFHKYY